MTAQLCRFAASPQSIGLIALAIVLVIFSFGFSVQEAEKTVASSPSEDREQREISSGMRVFLDPETGELAAPSEGQLLELDQLLSFDQGLYLQGDIVEQSSLQGGFFVEVPTSFYPSVVATVGPEGELSVKHASVGSGPEGTEVDALQFQGLTPDGALDRTFGDRAIVGSTENLSLAPGRIIIVNNDGAGEGFNDPAARAPVFGNPGTTLGAQRLNVFKSAADFWAAILKTTVDIKVLSQMDNQSCNASSAVLGSAGPRTVHRDFPGAPVTSTWYVQAVANSRRGLDLDTSKEDINATFNKNIDNNNACLNNTNWWYGIGQAAPAGTVDFFTVVLHEIGHGIGILSLVNTTTGAKFNGFNDAYMRWLWDFEAGNSWPNMNNAQRLASAINDPDVVFYGPRATDAARGLITAGMRGNVGYPRVHTPDPFQPGSSVSHFSTALSPNELMEPSITAPPGPYGYVTNGLLEDVGWRLLSNAVIDFGGTGTYTWNPTDAWTKQTSANPSNLEAWNGHFVGIYNGTWVRNMTTLGWNQITSLVPQSIKACGENLLWEYAGGTWRWNVATGWQKLTGADAQQLECWGGKMVWENAAGTWLYSFPGGWTKITGASPDRLEPCGPNLVWQAAAYGTWIFNFSTGWDKITSSNPETMECWRGKLMWENSSGTWQYDNPGWTQITGANPDQIKAWGPNLVWESAVGTYLYNGGWRKISNANPAIVAPFGGDLLWNNATGVWRWNGSAWSKLTSVVATEIVSTGVPSYSSGGSTPQ